MQQQYLVIKEYGEHELIIEKSKFICFIDRATSEKEAHDFIQKIKKMHYNATHNCSAYIIGLNGSLQKASDDGEPSGTAGIPMLEVLRKNDLTDTVCVVTRYFGGIKLGAGGLIRAYSSAVSETVKKVGISIKQTMQIIKLTASYQQIGLLDSRLTNYQIYNKTFLDVVIYEILVNINEVDNFINFIIDLTNNKINIEKTNFIDCFCEYN